MLFFHLHNNLQHFLLGEEKEGDQNSEQTSLKVDVSGWPSKQSPPGTGGTAAGQDEVDDLVQWSRELDEQQLMDM